MLRLSGWIAWQVFFVWVGAVLLPSLLGLLTTAWGKKVDVATWMSRWKWMDQWLGNGL